MISHDAKYKHFWRDFPFFYLLGLWRGYFIKVTLRYWFLMVPGNTWLYLTIPDDTWQYLAMPDDTKQYYTIPEYKFTIPNKIYIIWQCSLSPIQWVILSRWYQNHHGIIMTCYWPFCICLVSSWYWFWQFWAKLWCLPLNHLISKFVDIVALVLAPWL